jgi:O-antigen/teichoic acid export membrane protein
VTEEDASGDTGVPPDERDALLAIAHGAVVSSGGRSVKRLLSSWIEAVLTAGLGPILYGVYAFGWRVLGMLMRFANFGANRTLQRDVPALGTSLAIAIQNLLQVAVLYWFEGLWPFDATFLKPLGAGAGMAAVMVSVHATVPGTVSAIPGVLLGIVVFCISLWALGLNARDAFIIRELRGQYRDAVVQKFIDVQSVWRNVRR